jgi:hypothetical protein
MDAAPTVAGVSINDGSAQRSKVKSVTVTPNGIVPAGDIAPGAFVLNALWWQLRGRRASVSVSGRQTL